MVDGKTFPNSWKMYSDKCVTSISGQKLNCTYVFWLYESVPLNNVRTELVNESSITNPMLLIRATITEFEVQYKNLSQTVHGFGNKVIVQIIYIFKIEETYCII